jgi:hypothetical protein
MPAKSTGRTNAKGKHAHGKTGPVSLPVPTDQEREDMKPPVPGATTGRDVIVKVEEMMDEDKLDKLVTGFTVDASAAASATVRKKAPALQNETEPLTLFISLQPEPRRFRLLSSGVV